MTVIDAALMRIPDDTVAIEVRLSWPHYRELLAIKGLSTDPRQVRDWGSDYAARPLKVYRKHPLFFIQYASQVMVTRKAGNLTSIPIAYLPDQ